MDFLKIFHIDNGRKYFSLDELLDLINILSDNGYNMMEICPANGGMRFLLDDMTVKTDARTYESAEVKSAINLANKHFCDSRANELTESETLTLLSYAKEKNIMIMPLVNSPGHMEALAEAMEILGIKNVRYHDSCDTIDFESTEALAFTKEFVKKYIKWFSEHDCKFFNIGCDEYANDVLGSGFASLCNPDTFGYDKFINYVNELADFIIKAGMTPVMFNDGMYYDKHLEGGLLNKEIVGSYWIEGWTGYNLAPATFVEEQGHKIINTCSEWYYVLGRRKDSQNPQFNDEQTFEGFKKYGKCDVISGNKNKPIGAMFCLWTDEAEAEYNAEEKALLKKMLEEF